ncbi:hypothetical protein LCGC14_2218200 [marine sediment metagenome]|uniref:Uncharacterized protein n=1 Tax=marine sediment metagenome TaxID=412755 RepID=A0A0F9DBV6_9ZZZZ
MKIFKIISILLVLIIYGGCAMDNASPPQFERGDIIVYGKKIGIIKRGLVISDDNNIGKYTWKYEVLFKNQDMNVLEKDMEFKLHFPWHLNELDPIILQDLTNPYMPKLDITPKPLYQSEKST